MNQKIKPAAIATKIKKWAQTVQQLQTEDKIFAISITRLTSVKSLCQDETAAQRFALYLSQKVQQQMNQAECPKELLDEEWETHKNIVASAITQMENYLGTQNEQGKQSLQGLLKKIDQCQGDDYRRVHWNTVHFVRSGYLLKLEYALRCFVQRDFPDWAYKLAREYVERYDPSYGTGLIPESVPMLLEVAEFWCHYYFGQSLSEKFPALYKESS
jgi:hypothetical protein